MSVMDIKRYRRIRAAAVLFIVGIVALAAFQGSYLLAIIGILTGMLLLSSARLKAKITLDEREQAIREKAAQATYAIFAPTIGIGAFFLILSARGEFLYLEALGMVLAYLALFLVTLYAISYHFFNRKYGGGGDEE